MRLYFFEVDVEDERNRGLHLRREFSFVAERERNHPRVGRRHLHALGRSNGRVAGLQCGGLRRQRVDIALPELRDRVGFLQESPLAVTRPMCFENFFLTFFLLHFWLTFGKL